MSEPITIRVFEVVGSGLCVASDDGQKVHDQIATGLRQGHGIRLSFLNVESLTSAFLNAAVGQLYGEFSEEQIKSSLSVSNIEPDDLTLLKRVVETAKQYFRDPERFTEAVRNVVGEDDEE